MVRKAFKVMNQLSEKKVKSLEVETNDSFSNMFPGECKNICFMLDTSGSFMPQWYEQVADHVNGVIDDLVSDNVPRRFAAINYSYETIYSGWQSESGIENVRAVINKYQGMGTEVNLDTMRDMIISSDEAALILVSDGEIHESGYIVDLLDGYDEMIKKVGVIFMGESGQYCFDKWHGVADTFLVDDPKGVNQVMSIYSDMAMKGKMKAYDDMLSKR